MCNCPNCNSNEHIWDDCTVWGCSKCGWCSLQGLNRTPTASFVGNKYDEAERKRTWGYTQQQKYEREMGYKGTEFRDKK